MSYTDTNFDEAIFFKNKTGAVVKTRANYCNLEKTDGLFICKINELDKNFHLLLSSLDETIVQYNCSFQLATHKFPDVYQPQGSIHICKSINGAVHSTIYCMGPIKLKKELLLLENENRLLIRYTLQEAKITSQIQFQPFLAYRGLYSLGQVNSTLKNKYKYCQNGLIFEPYNFYPELVIQFSEKVNYCEKADWYYNFEYKESENNFVYEDLYSPGFFELYLNKNQRLIVSIGLKEIDTKNLSLEFENEVHARMCNKHEVRHVKANAKISERVFI